MSIPQTKRGAGGKFTKADPTISTDQTQKHLLTEKPESHSLKMRLEVMEASNRTLQNTLNESRKISREREEQLAEEQRKHGLSRMSDANARNILSQIAYEIGGDPDEAVVEKVRGLMARYSTALSDLSVAKKDTEQMPVMMDRHNHLSGILQEINKRFPSCDEIDLPQAVESLLARCNAYGERADRMGEANTQLQVEIREFQEICAEIEGHLGVRCAHLSKLPECLRGNLNAARANEEYSGSLIRSLNEQCGTLRSEKRLAEGRYVALSRSRSIERGILIVATVGAVLIAAVVAMLGGGK